jgi:hypothetical protein
MNTLNPLGARPFQQTALPSATQQTGGSNARAHTVQNVNSDNAVSLSSNGIDLQKRVDRLGNATVDLAQNLLGSFAQQLFGDDAKGAKISFDSVSLESSSSFAAGVSHSEDASGVTDAAALSLTDNAHFLGKGTITTADGRKFDFEVEIKYQASLQAAASSSTSSSSAPSTASSIPSRRQQLADQNPAMPLPTIEFPDIDFPGSLADLFKLMDRTMKADVKQDGSSDPQGTLSMRLLKLVDSEASLDTYLPPTASDKARSVANAYGRQQTEPGQAAELAHAAQAARDAKAEVAPPAKPVEPPASAATIVAPIEDAPAEAPTI